MVDRNKIIKAVLILAGILTLVGALTQVKKQNSQTLDDYAKENPEIAYAESETLEADISDNAVTDTDSPQDKQSLQTETTENLQEESDKTIAIEESTLIGAILNGSSLTDQRYTYTEQFYYEPLSDNLRRYITGVSFPVVDETTENLERLEITYEDLCYLHVLHYDFEGNPAEGELICNKAIAQDLVEIFYELYYNEYRIEKIRLIDEYDGDDTASMEDNNTSCFNYRVVEGSTSLSKHALGLALDINPLYNPYITYERDEAGNIAGEKVSPVSGQAYADRDKSFPYKIDENDLCYKLFTEHGFVWGGNWNSCKDYQHFQKVVE